MSLCSYTSNQLINNFVFIGETNRHINPNGSIKRKAKFKCFCGNVFETQIANVKSKATKSCGCVKLKKLIERNTTHNLSYHPLYSIWCDIKQRCYNKNAKNYKYYGSRGIKMCQEWFNNPEMFIEWCLSNFYKKGLQIDRTDNYKGYKPSNCRFITQKENLQNTRQAQDKKNKYDKKLKAFFV